MKDPMFFALHAELQQQANEILGIKGSEYPTGNGDRLSNFKEVATLLGLTPTQALGVYLLKHVLSICTFIRECRSDEPGREPISGRIADMNNYGSLLYALLVEEGRIADTRASLIVKNFSKDLVGAVGAPVEIPNFAFDEQVSH